MSREGYIRSGPNAVQAPEQPDQDLEAVAPKARRNAGEEEEQVLWMGNERFSGPELLYNPSDIGGLPLALCHMLTGPGIQQTGLAETVAYVISCMPPELQGMFWAHIGVVGGLGNIEALGERL